jgi:hypothetical protein
MEALLGSFLLFVQQWGLPLVLLGIVIIWLKPKIDELWEIAIRRADTRQVMVHQDGFDQILQADIDLNSLITEVLHETEADYVTIWQFHNGAVSFGGIPFLRISVTHQQVIHINK